MFEWTRFWCPFGDEISLDEGFLLDPLCQLGQLLNKRLVSTAMGIDAWAIADEITHLSDPAALMNHKDVIGFMTVLNRKPFLLRECVWEALKKADEKLSKDLESFTKAWELTD